MDMSLAILLVSLCSRSERSSIPLGGINMIYSDINNIKRLLTIIETNGTSSARTNQRVRPSYLLKTTVASCVKMMANLINSVPSRKRPLTSRRKTRAFFCSRVSHPQCNIFLLLGHRQHPQQPRRCKRRTSQNSRRQTASSCISSRAH